MKLLPFINLNGAIVDAENAFISVSSSAFRYGYGLFETILVTDGQIQLKELHWQRLWRGFDQLQFPLGDDLSASFLEDQILKTVRINRTEEICRVRLELYMQGNQVRFVVECFDCDKEVTRLNQNALTVGIVDSMFKGADQLSALKTTNYLLYFLAKKISTEKGWDDALILNTSQNIIESTIANIFWTKNNIIYTPPVSEGCIAGVMRQYLITELPKLGYVVRETGLTEDQLSQADEVFLTNAVRRIKWIGTIDKRSFGNKLTTAVYADLFT